MNSQTPTPTPPEGADPEAEIETSPAPVARGPGGGGGGGGGRGMGQGPRQRQGLEDKPGRRGGGMGPGRARLQAVAAEAETVDFPDPGPEIAPQRLHPQPARRMVPAEPSGPVAGPAQPARMRTRHYGVLVLALLMIALPGAVSAWYLWTRAADQYESVAGFSIRTEQASSPFDFLGAFGGGTSSTGKDMDILNNYITSQQLVALLDDKLDLRALFSKPTNDPYFAYDTTGKIEDLVDYWRRMVVVNYDSTTGLMQLYVRAFSPQDAQMIAQAVLDQSTETINKLAAVAQDDTTRYAAQSLETAKAKLAASRAAVTKFRVTNNIVDPTLDLAAQGNVIGSLTQQLVASQIDLEILKSGNAGDNDPRVQAVQRKITVIQAKIAEEQSKVSVPMGADLASYADLLAEYESLRADEEFDGKTYAAALASYDVAVTDAQHKSVYLANFEDPTLPESATLPNRILLLLTVMTIGFFSWAIVTLVYYALRDRR